MQYHFQNLFMKKIIVFLSLAVGLTTLSCNDKTKEPKKEVIVVPASPAVTVKDAPAKSTSVSVDQNGVKVETKKVGVSVKK